MKTNEKIEALKNAITMSEERRSKLTEENFAIPGLVSLLGRHLYNNVGAISTKLLEVGSHLGCSFTSSISHNNLISCTSVDSFASDWVEDRKCMPLFLENVSKHLPENTVFNFIHSDAFEVDLNEVPDGIDFYIYDGGHSHDQQRLGVTYYLPKMANEFVMVVDDFDWDDVHNGTYKGIIDGELDVIWQHIFEGNDHDNDGAWNGYGVFLLKKTK
jgi:hypothetical protein